MIRLAPLLFCPLAAAAASGPAHALPAASVAFAGPEQAAQLHKKQPGDLSYETLWRMQKRVASMLPKNGEMLTPVLQLAVGGSSKRERNEFLPSSWAIAIKGRTVDTVLPMRRGGFFEIPALPQAQVRSEAAFVRFNTRNRKKWFEVAWQLAVPSDGTLRYGQLARAFDELKVAQRDMPWWDIMLIDEKNARFDAVRACFATVGGAILVSGTAAGSAVSPHCALLPFNAAQAAANAPVQFVGALESVTLDNTSHYSTAN